MGIGIAEGGMAVITVKKEGLLTTLKANRDSHRAAYEGAMTGYRLALIGACEAKLADAKAGKRVGLKIDLVEPFSNEKDYDRIIRMLEMSINDEIHITEEEFNKYVMDDWSWKQGFATTNARYAEIGGRFGG